MKPNAPTKYAETAIIKTTAIVPKYREGCMRGRAYASIRTGMTVAEFCKANGGKSSMTYLIWFANKAGVVSVG